MTTVDEVDNSAGKFLFAFQDKDCKQRNQQDPQETACERGQSIGSALDKARDLSAMVTQKLLKLDLCFVIPPLPISYLLRDISGPDFLQ